RGQGSLSRPFLNERSTGSVPKRGGIGINSRMNFEGFTPHEFNRWSSLVEQDDPTALPEGVAGVARNVSFRLNSVRTRDGINWQFQTPTKDQPITGLASLINQQPSASTQVPLIFDMGGRMNVESPVGSGTLVQVARPPIQLPDDDN